MMKKISQILFAIIIALMIVSCKNTKQKLQEYVVSYNKTATDFKSENVTLTTARGYINDNKIELRFETDLKQNETNKTEAVKRFPEFLKEMINKDLNFKELVEEGVQFDVYFLADDNTVLAKQIINKEELTELLKK
jgi:PBP1b-binding outer membrane lipoprotein LpoB